MSGEVEAERDAVSEAVFGGFDGFNTSLAVIFGSRHRLLLSLMLCISVAAALSMAAGEFVSALRDPDRSVRDVLPLAGVMGAFTFAGTAAPCVPALFLGHGAAVVLALGIGVVAALVVGWVNGRGRRPGEGWWRDYAISFGVFVVVAVPTGSIAALTGAGA